MKFDLLVFTQYPKAYAPCRIVEEALKMNLNVKVLGYDDINPNNLPDSSSVILREPNPENTLYELRDEILKHYMAKNVRVLNSDSYTKWSVLDKMTQTDEFQKSAIPHVQIKNLDDLDYPYIAKNKLGSHGDSVYKIENIEDLNKVLSKHKKEDLLFQEFINTGFDLRTIVLNNRVLGIMKRTPKTGQFLSNYSQGGEVVEFKTDDSELNVIKKIALNAANHFKLDYVGVDLMKNNDGDWVVLEVNRACQFKGFEVSTGKNVALQLVEFMTKKD